MHMLRIEWFFPAMLLIIGGRYMTSPGTAGTAERALVVTDALIAQLRKA